MLFNTWSVDGKYPVQYSQNLQLPIQMQVSEKRKIFLNFLFYFLNLHQILNILKKEMMIIANLFPKLQSVKNFVTPLWKKRRFRTPLESEHVKVSRKIAKSRWERFYQVFSSFFGKLI